MQYCALLCEAITQLTAADIEEARLDAEILLAEARGLSRASLRAHLDDPVDPETANLFNQFVARRAQHEPVAYILNRKEFYGLEFIIDRRALIPRPETELLVEQALERLSRRQKADGVQPLVIDVGTGSGAIAIALVKNCPSPLTLIAVDVSPAALALARANAQKHHVADHIQFVQTDLLANVEASADLIVANLPYISAEEWRALAPDITDYEPYLALNGGADGLEAFRRFFASAPAHLAPGGVILLEIGWKQSNAVRALARTAFPRALTHVLQDGAGLDRVVVMQTP